jgi:CBS domain-containing protein
VDTIWSNLLPGTKVYASSGKKSEKMSGQDVNQLPVVEDGRLVGVLSRDAIIRAVQVRQELGRQRGDKG